MHMRCWVLQTEICIVQVHVHMSKCLCAQAAAAAYKVMHLHSKSQPGLPGPVVGSCLLICTLRYSH